MRWRLVEPGAICLGLALGLAACGGERREAGEGGEAPAAAGEARSAAEPGEGSGYAVTEVMNGGAIRGTVRFSGTVPPPRAVTVTEDAEACGASQEIQPLEVGARGGLANAVVSLVDISRGAALQQPASPPELDQRGCRFSPHVLFAPVGRPLHILNSDPITHNVHTVTFENRPLNRAQPKELHRIEATFVVPEKVKVNCDIHDWMSAWIIVIDHPYHALTDREGRFAIENVPPGDYTLEIWHESVGTTSESVSVTAGETSEVSVALSQG